MVIRYAKVSVPAHLMERLSAIVRARPELGYRSASDAVTECLRRRVDELDHMSSVWYKEPSGLQERTDVALWVPVCPGCGLEGRRLVYLPGDENGPANIERLYAHWTCRSCGQRNYLPTSRWVRKTDAR